MLPPFKIVLHLFIRTPGEVWQRIFKLFLFAKVSASLGVAVTSANLQKLPEKLQLLLQTGQGEGVAVTSANKEGVSFGTGG